MQRLLRLPGVARYAAPLRLTGGILLAVFVLYGTAASHVAAQVPTTVQLPTFTEFSVSTTVSVPDRGGMVLGGIGRSSQSSISRGVPGASKLPGAGRLFTNRGIGSEAGASTVSAHVWVHDFAELDAITRAAARPTSAESEIDRKAAFLSKHVSRRSTTK